MLLKDDCFSLQVGQHCSRFCDRGVAKQCLKDEKHTTVCFKKLWIPGKLFSQIKSLKKFDQNLKKMIKIKHFKQN